MVRLMRRRRLLRLCPILLGLGAGLLVSCAAQPPYPPQTAMAGRGSRPPSETAPPRYAPRPMRKPIPPSPAGSPAPAQNPESSAISEQRGSAGPLAPEAALAPPEATDASNAAGPVGSPPPHIELIGLDQSSATRLLGPAAERSEEPPATVWRYKNGACELDLFFYLDLRSGRMRTLHYALKDGANDTMKRQDCLRSFTAFRGR